MSLTREQILAPRPLPREEVDVPELGGTVFVRVMTGIERDAYEARLRKNPETRAENAHGRLLVYCLCDPEGKLLFDPDDADALGQQQWQGLERATIVALRLNMMNDEAIEIVKGNLQPTPGAAQS